MPKNRKIIICIILVAAAILIIAGIVFVKVVCPLKHYDQICPIKIYSPTVSISSNECANQNGRIINTLSGEQCNNEETNVGSVQGMRCPCICCIPKDKNQPSSNKRVFTLAEDVIIFTNQTEYWQEEIIKVGINSGYKILTIQPLITLYKKNGNDWQATARLHLNGEQDITCNIDYPHTCSQPSYEKYTICPIYFNWNQRLITKEDLPICAGCEAINEQIESGVYKFGAQIQKSDNSTAAFFSNEFEIKK